jgi:hypothetical protein
MLNFLKKLFKSKPSENKPILDEHGNEIDDKWLNEAVNRAFKSGKSVMVNVNEDGTAEVVELED